MGPPAAVSQGKMSSMKMSKAYEEEKLPYIQKGERAEHSMPFE
jgi:hypothetical protein